MKQEDAIVNSLESINQWHTQCWQWMMKKKKIKVQEYRKSNPIKI